MSFPTLIQQDAFTSKKRKVNLFDHWTEDLVQRPIKPIQTENLDETIKELGKTIEQFQSDLMMAVSVIKKLRVPKFPASVQSSDKQKKIHADKSDLKKAGENYRKIKSSLKEAEGEKSLLEKLKKVQELKLSLDNAKSTFSKLQKTEVQTYKYDPNIRKKLKDQEDLLDASKTRIKEVKEDYRRANFAFQLELNYSNNQELAQESLIDFNTEYQNELKNVIANKEAEKQRLLASTTKSENKKAKVAQKALKKKALATKEAEMETKRKTEKAAEEAARKTLEEGIDSKFKDLMKKFIEKPNDGKSWETTEPIRCNDFQDFEKELSKVYGDKSIEQWT